LPFVLKRYALGLAKVTRKIFSMLRLNTSFKNESRKYCNTNDLDAFIQFDQSQPLAMLHKKNAKNYFIAYDLIPFVLENDYLWSYRIARSNNKNIVESVLAATNRNMYIRKIKINSKKAHKLLAISETTKHDFEKYANVPPEKIEVINLGVNIANKNHKASNNDGMVDRYYSTSWGYITKKESLKNQHFLLFVGGVDHRRKLDDVITAFNHLRAQGEDIKLVLSGDIMLGAEAITTESAREALSKS
jgi:glycosyltransferase involved in cell wall biosynthesis